MPFRFMKPRTDVASAEQVRAAREGRGWTLEQMADAVAATPLEVSAWESGAVAAPPLQAARVHWMLETDRRSAAAARIGIEPCGWVRERVPHLYQAMLADVAGDTWYAETRDHVDACDTCYAMWKAVKRLGPPPPEPDEATFDTLRGRFDRWTQRFPGWIGRPLNVFGDLGLSAAFGAALVLLLLGVDSGLAALGLGAGLGCIAYRIVRDGTPDGTPRWPWGAQARGGVAAAATCFGIWSIFAQVADSAGWRGWAGFAALLVVWGLIRRAQTADLSPGQEQAPAIADDARPALAPPQPVWAAVGRRGEPAAVRNVVENGGAV